MQYYKVSKLQHLIVAEYYTSSFSADLIPMLSYFIAVTIISYIATVAEHAVLLTC